MTAAPKRAVIYSRVSKDATGEARSNERQEEACRGLATARGWEVVATCRDVSVSAYGGKKRSGWDEVRSYMDNGEVDVVIAWAMDRVTRSMVELEDLIVQCERTGVALATATGEIDLTTDTGKMVARILAAVARAEVERKAARQRLANHQRASEGHPWRSGWQAFGYTLDGDLIPHEADTFRETFDAVLAGHWSLKEAARRWTERGHRSRGGTSGSPQWTHRGVKAVLLSPRYAGIATYRGNEVGQGNWEALVTREEHSQMKAVLNDPARRTNSGKGGRTAETLLAGLARCSECGTTVNGGKSHGRDVYKCKSSRECVRTPRSAADNFVLDGVRAAIRAVGPDNLFAAPDELVSRVALNQITVLQERRNALARAFASGAIVEEALRAGSSSIDQQLQEIEASASPAITSKRLNLLGPERVEAIRRLDALGLHELRRLIASVADIVFLPVGRGRRNVSIHEQVTGWITVLGSDDAIDLGELLRTDQSVERPTP